MELTAVIVDDVAEELERARSVLSTEPGIRVIGEASSGFEALPILEQLHPDVLVLDLGLPDLGGLQVLQRLTEISPRTKAIVVSGGTRTPTIASAMRGGASGFLSKAEIGYCLVPAIRDVMKGQRYISPRCLDILVFSARITLPIGLDTFEELTDRQREVSALTDLSFTAAEIGLQLKISRRAVEGHRANSLERLGLSNVTALAQVARVRRPPPRP